MAITNFKWANANAWASQMVTSPMGPFADPIGKSLIDDLIEMANWNYTLDSDTPFTIDPTVFVAEFAGQWYIVYHVSNGPNGGGTYQREVAMEKLTFNADGTIKKIVPTTGITFE